MPFKFNPFTSELDEVGSSTTGGSSISNPYIAYVRTNGDDGTAEIGNPAKPYLTAQAAWLALKSLHNNITDAHVFNIGFGEFALTLTPAEVAAGYEIFVTGEGGPESSVLNITSSLPPSGSGGNGAAGANGSGGDGDFGANAPAPGEEGGPVAGGVGEAGDSLDLELHINSDLSVTVALNFSSGSGGSGGTGGAGGNGEDGSINGGLGAQGAEGGAGGAGGDITGSLYLAGVVAILNFSASGGAGGGGGQGGQEGSPGSNLAANGESGSPGADGVVTAELDARLCIITDSPFLINPSGNFYDGLFA
jgi:hypothetical protein